MDEADVLKALTAIYSIVASGDDRAVRAAQVAEVVRELGSYRWVGIYDVGATTVSIISYSGPGAPAYPVFPITEGLTGAAIVQRRGVVVGDVRKDSRYLTAFGTTLSEIIIPVLNSRGVVGTIDVESERLNAFSDGDRMLLERVATATLPLWQ